MEKTGLDIAGYLAAPWRRETQRRARPKPAAKGPLAGERVAIIASPHNTELPALIAAAGGRVMADVGRTTTMLVVAGERPFSSGVRTAASYLKAEALAADGGVIRIVTAEELRDQISAAAQARQTCGQRSRSDCGRGRVAMWRPRPGTALSPFG